MTTIPWPTPERHPITRVGAPPAGMSWGDRMLAAGLLAAMVGGIAGAAVLTGGLLYLGWRLGGALARG